MFQRFFMFFFPFVLVLARIFFQDTLTAQSFIYLFTGSSLGGLLIHLRKKS